MLRKILFRIAACVLLSGYLYISLYYWLMSTGPHWINWEPGMSHTHFVFGYRKPDPEHGWFEIDVVDGREFYYYFFEPVDSVVNPERKGGEK